MTDSAIRLVDVYETGDYGLRVLRLLLGERTAAESISHKTMPQWYDHCQFVGKKPYLAWYLIESEQANSFVGAIYLTKQREVGLFIFKAYRSLGLGTKALRLLLEKHPGKVLANINPRNVEAIEFWEKQGFSPLQATYVLEP